MSHDDIFERGSSYDEMLRHGIDLSGESKEFFIAGRIAQLRSRLHHALPRIGTVLDFGCGVGDTTTRLADAFPQSTVTGVDVADGALEEARRRVDDPRVRFARLDEMRQDEFDLCYVNGMFHHVPAHERVAVTRRIHGLLRPDAVAAVFDNNPLSIPARLVMRRIPFDRDAVMLRAGTVRRLLDEVGFEPMGRVDYLFYMPSALRSLRRVEPAFRHIPLGAQYLVLGRKLRS